MVFGGAGGRAWDVLSAIRLTSFQCRTQRRDAPSLLDTEIGAESVLETLGRIEHGVFA